MAEVLKVLGQVNPLATTLTTAYTVPGATSAVVSTIVVCNQGTQTTFRIAVRLAGAAIDPKHYIAYDAQLLANEVWGFTMGLTLATTDVVSVYAGTANVSFGIYGEEVT